MALRIPLLLVPVVLLCLVTRLGIIRTLSLWLRLLIFLLLPI